MTNIDGFKASIPKNPDQLLQHESNILSLETKNMIEEWIPQMDNFVGNHPKATQAFIEQEVVQKAKSKDDNTDTLSV